VRFAKSAFNTVHAYAAMRGYTVFDPIRQLFQTPDGKHHVRFVETRGDIVFVWDTQAPLGRVMLKRAS
jgi:hypothetical protein